MFLPFVLATSIFAVDPQVQGPANTLLVVSMADAATTRAQFVNPRCGHVYERNPIARPFVRSDASMVGFVVASNLLARVVFRHSATAFRILTVLDAGAVGDNVRQLTSVCQHKWAEMAGRP